MLIMNSSLLSIIPFIFQIFFSLKMKSAPVNDFQQNNFCCDGLCLLGATATTERGEERRGERLHVVQKLIFSYSVNNSFISYHYSTFKVCNSEVMHNFNFFLMHNDKRIKIYTIIITKTSHNLRVLTVILEIFRDENVSTLIA